MTDYDSPHEKLRQEFEILMGQNNTILRETPVYTVGQLFQLADAVRRKHDIPLTDVTDEGPAYLLHLDDGSQVAAIGLDDYDAIAELDVHMLDDRTIGRRS